MVSMEQSLVAGMVPEYAKAGMSFGWEVWSRRAKAHQMVGFCRGYYRRSPNLPHTCACSTIGPARLNFRVRDGNGWDPRSMVTGKLIGVVLIRFTG